MKQQHSGVLQYAIGKQQQQHWQALLFRWRWAETLFWRKVSYVEMGLRNLLANGFLLQYMWIFSYDMTLQ